MDGGENHLARVGGVDGGGKRDRVAHFTDHHDVGILPQRGAQAGVESFRVETDFALLDDRLVVLEHVLDGVFHRDDVFAEIRVYVLDHGGERGGFARAGRAREQHDAARRFRDLAHNGRQTEMLEVGDRILYVAHRHRHLAALLEDVRAETSDAVDEVGEVRLALDREVFLHVRREDVGDDLVHPLHGGNGRLNGNELAADAEHDWPANFDVQV